MRHYQPNESNWNVLCLNGSAHAWRTHRKEHVTCSKCKDILEGKAPHPNFKF